MGSRRAVKAVWSRWVPSLHTEAKGRVCLEWRWDGVQPGQTDVMLLGFNTTIKRLEDQDGQCVFELQEGLVRLTQRHPDRNSEDVVVFQGSPLNCKAADVIVESRPRKTTLRLCLAGPS